MTEREALKRITRDDTEHGKHYYLADEVDALLAQPEQETVAWRNAALRVGEDLCSVGPFGYYDMTAEQWLTWALSVVTVHAPPPQPKEPEQETVAIDVGQLEYKGNSVGYIYQKMQAYRLGIDNAWSALRAKDIHPDGKTSLADMIAKHFGVEE